MSPAERVDARASRTQGPQLVYEHRGERIAFPIVEGEMFIGRKDDCDLCFPDGSVSKRHVRILRTGTLVELFDAGSKNGTLVNEESVTRVELFPGDVIQIGKITLTYDDGAGEGSTAAAPAGQWRSGGANDSFRDFDDFAEDESTKARDSTDKRGDKKSQARSRDKDEASDLSKSEKQSKASRASKAPEAAKPAAVVEEKATFTVADGKDKGRVFELKAGGALTIGTKDGNAVQIVGEGISRYHAEVVFENGIWLLKDLGSRNGVFVADKKIDLHELGTGDVVQIGTTRLRFERLGAPAKAAAADPAELFKLLKEDPKAFFKTPTGRRAAFGVIALILLILVFYPTQPDVDPRTTGQATVAGLHEALDFLRKGLVPQARDTVQHARQSLPGENLLLKDAEELVKVFEQRKILSINFDWKTAGAVLERMQKDGEQELRPDERAWLLAELKTVAEETTNSAFAKTGSKQMEIAADAERRKDGVAKIEALKAALAAYRSIPRESVMHEGAQQQAKKIRERLFQSYQQEAERRVEGDKPDWPAAIALLGDALRYAETLAERATVQRKQSEYETNQKDEQTYAAIVDIVNARNTAKYDEAIIMGNTIKKESRVFTDAQTYLHWIQADRDVRLARVKYDEGDWEKARALLLGALTWAKDFGNEAKASVTKRLEQWQKVVSTYAEGLESMEAGDFYKAEEKFNLVLSLETNAANRFRKMAVARLSIIHDTEKQDIADAEKDGFNYLSLGRWRDANEKFNYIIRKTDGTPAKATYRGKFETAVVVVEKKEHLYDKAKDVLLHDETGEFENAKDSLLILQYLPKGEQRTRAKELYEKFKTRLVQLISNKNAIEEGQKGD